jgi:hypothetical protein
MIHTIQHFWDTYKNSKRLWMLKLAATAVVVYLVNKSLAHTHVKDVLERISAVPVILALILACAGFYMQAVRWRRILRCMDIHINNKNALRTMLWGSLLAFVTPGRSGELLRGIMLPAARKRDTVYAVIIEKCFAGAVTLALGLICAVLAVVRCGHIIGMQWVVIMCSVVVFAGYAGAIYAVNTLQRLRAAHRILSMFSVRSLVDIGAYSFGIHIILLIQSALLLAMFGSADVWANVYAVGQAYAFMIFFPFFIANMGIREYSFGLFLGYLVPALTTGTAVAFGTSIGILVLNIILPALLGLAGWFFQKTTRM